MPDRSPSGRYTDWSAVVRRLRRAPGRRERTFVNVPVSVARTIRQRRHPDLRFEGGHLEAEVLNEYVDDVGTKRGDVYVTYIQDA